MEVLGDDILTLILQSLDDQNDRNSFSQVSKQWLRVQGQNRSNLRLLDTQNFQNLIPRFPNLTKFEFSGVFSSTHLDVLAKSCPSLEILSLNFKKGRGDCGYGEFIDFDDYGLCFVANVCTNLRKLSLRRRKFVGNFGVFCIVEGLKNLRSLDLGKCERVTDMGLDAIGRSNSLQVLNLGGCCLITDVGLEFLANGPLSKTIKKLVLAECDRITDIGVWYLKQMCCLEELSLAECGPKVTDTGGVALSEIRTLKRLNLSWLMNVTDLTLVAIARECRDLVGVDLTGCESITGFGLRAFANHETLEELVLAFCHNFSGQDVEMIVYGCKNLVYVALDNRMKMWMSTEFESLISRKNCWIDWT